MKRFPLLSGLIGLAAIGVIALLPVSVPEGDDIRIANTDIASPPIVDNMVVSQEFPATGKNLTSLAVLLGTYKRVNHGQIILILAAQQEGNWQVLAKETLAKEMIRDNTFTTVTFTPPLAVRTGTLLRLTLQSPDRPENGIAWWTSPDVSRPGFSLAVNDQEQKGTASFAVTYTHPTGRLFQMIGPIWGRMTIFLGPGWRLVLLLGLMTIVATLPMTSARLLAGVRWPARPRVDTASPTDTHDDPSGAADYAPAGVREEK
jgi:hypothetical protein